MPWWGWFFSGCAAMYLVNRFLLGYARGKMSSSKALRQDFFGKMRYDSLLKVKAALDDELAAREGKSVQ